jgi:hypothetical protein
MPADWSIARPVPRPLAAALMACALALSACRPPSAPPEPVLDAEPSPAPPAVEAAPVPEIPEADLALVEVPPAPRSLQPVEEFEGREVPAGLDADAGGALRITTVRSKSGVRALAWRWTKPDASLWIRRPAELALWTTLKGGDRNSATLAFWCHRAEPGGGTLRLEFHGATGVLARCWFHTDFRGWRALGAPWADVLGACRDTVTAVRVMGPRGRGVRRALPRPARPVLRRAAAGRLPAAVGRRARRPGPRGAAPLQRRPTTRWADPGCPRGPRWCRPRCCAMRRTCSCAWPARWWPRRPRTSCCPPTVSPNWRPRWPSTGCASRTASWRASRSRTAVSTSRPAASTSPPPTATWARWGRAFRETGDPAQRAQIRGWTLALGRLLLDHGWAPGNRNAGSTEGGYAERDWPGGLFACREALADTPEWADLLRQVIWFFGGPNAAAERPWGDTDIHLNGTPSFIQAIARLPVGPEQVQLLLIAQRYLNLTYVQDTLLPPDGTVRHHDMFHLAYGSYSMPSLVSMAQWFEGTGFAVSDAALDRLKEYVRTAAWVSNLHSVPANANGRAGNPLGVDVSGLGPVAGAAAGPLGSRASGALPGQEHQPAAPRGGRAGRAGTHRRAAGGASHAQLRRGRACIAAGAGWPRSSACRRPGAGWRSMGGWMATTTGATRATGRC